MAQKKFSPIRGESLRVTRTDGCGRLVSGACTSYATDAFVSIEVAPRTAETEAIEVVKANGKKCVNESATTYLDGFDLTVTFCGVDPVLFEMVTKMPVVYDYNGDPVGYKADVDVDTKNHGFALETWTQVPSDACSDDGSGNAYGYLLFPFLRPGVLGNFTIENGAITFSVSGLATRSGTAWGVGPYDVTESAQGVPSPLLEPLSKTDHHTMFITNVEPPEPGDDCESSGSLATGATAGDPGTWTPVNSYAPASLVDLQGASITASPTTAWTTGQHVVLGGGGKAHWDGSGWVSGEAS